MESDLIESYYPGCIISRGGFVAVVVGKIDDEHYIVLGKRSAGKIKISVIVHCRCVWNHTSACTLDNR